MKKRLIFLVLAASLFACPAKAVSAVPPDNSAESMILMHGESGLVLCEKNADEPMLIASTTKIMTALVALECLNPDDEVVIDPAWTKVEGSSMYLRPGETYTVKELLYGLLLASGNDAALALACAAAGSPEMFAERMNERAQELGLDNTHFTNPHGLDSDQHYSTAKDLAVIMAHAMEQEMFAEIVSSRSFSTHGATYVNHNKLLWRCEGVVGGKTGYTKAAGRCLVSACQRDGLSLICVTLSDRNDWQDHANVYDWAYRKYEARVCPGNVPLVRVPVVSGNAESVGAAPQSDITLCIPKGSNVDMCFFLPRFIFAGIEGGTLAGEMAVYVDEEKAGIWPLCWLEDVSPVDRTGMSILKNMTANILGVYYF